MVVKEGWDDRLWITGLCSGSWNLSSPFSWPGAGEHHFFLVLLLSPNVEVVLKSGHKHNLGKCSLSSRFIAEEAVIFEVFFLPKFNFIQLLSPVLFLHTNAGWA